MAAPEIATTRPLPPPRLRMLGDHFAPARDLHQFILSAFIQEGAPFYRPEYEHLRDARIGVLWTNVEKVKNGVAWAASAELVTTGGDKWTKGRSLMQLEEWFGEWWPMGDDDSTLPDFVLTFFAPAAGYMNDIGFCATVAHELRHCAQKRDRFDEPAFDQLTGRPLFTILDHDVSTFLSVAEDFGDVERNVAELVEIVNRNQPRFPGALVEGICGVCGKAAA